MNKTLPWQILSGLLFILLILAWSLHPHKPAMQQYTLLNPALSSQTIEEFKAYQTEVRISYINLRPKIQKILNSTNGTYGVYFEDLLSGANVGVNERLEFTPRSLFKTTTAAAVLKSIEEGDLNFEDNITLTSEMLNSYYGDLFTQGDGYTTNISNLLYLSLAESDNTASNALRSTVPLELIEQARLAMGVPYPAPNITVYELSPKSYARVFRSLYHSSYLQRPYSQYELDLLLQSKQNHLIPMGVPDNVLVAHKIGEDSTSGQYHDCGIIYHPLRPYILCIMSKNTTEANAGKIIPQISQLIYEEVNQPNHP